jgi:hypothetical protein
MKVGILPFSLIFLALFSCGTSPSERNEKEPSRELGWHYEGIENQKIPGKTIRVWENTAQGSVESKSSFAVLEVIKGADVGQFHIGFLASKRELGTLGFYEYDQRQNVDIHVFGESYPSVSLRRTQWDRERDFIGFLNQGNSLVPAQKIYNALKESNPKVPVELKFKSLTTGQMHHYSFDLGYFLEDREILVRDLEEGN